MAFARLSRAVVGYDRRDIAGKSAGRPAREESPCSRPPSPAACRSRPGWPSPTSCGRRGGSRARSSSRPRRDATLLAIKEQEDAGIDIVGDGEQARQHFVHGFLERVEGIDFAHKVEMGIRADRYKAMVPQVVGPLRLQGPRARDGGAGSPARTPSSKLKFTLPGPMTIADTIADRHYGDKVKMALAFADLLNEEARALEKDGVDVDPVRRAGLQRLHGRGDASGASRRWSAPPPASSARPPCTSATATASRPTSTGRRRSAASGGSTRRSSRRWRRARSTRCRWNAATRKVPLSLLAPARRQGRAGRRHRRGQRRGRDARGGGRRRSAQAIKHVPKERIQLCTNCGMAPMRRDVAYAKLAALAQGAALARERYA